MLHGYRTVGDIESCESCSQGLLPVAVHNSEAVRPWGPERSEYRPAFARDRDKITHSMAFQRLVHKTQMFCGTDPAKYTTRLLHTLKVCQVAQTLARALRLNEDLASAIALGHDLGHSPFGHVGEDVLRSRLIKLNGFEHNEESVIIALFLERLNLTFQTLEGILKHTKCDLRPYENANVQRQDPFHVLKLPGRPSRTFADVFKYLGPKDKDGKATFLSAPSYEAQVVDIADEIAYVVHDLEDCLARKIIDEEDLPGEWHEEFADDPRNAIDELVSGVIEENIGKLIHASPNSPKEALSHTDRLSTLVARMKEWYSKEIYPEKLGAEKAEAERMLNQVFDLFVGKPRLLKEYVHPTYFERLIRRGFRGELLVGHCVTTLTDHEVIQVYDGHCKGVVK